MYHRAGTVIYRMLIVQPDGTRPKPVDVDALSNTHATARFGLPEKLQRSGATNYFLVCAQHVE